MMILPPLSLPFGGEITCVHPTKKHDSRTSSSAKRRSLSKQNNNEQIQTSTTTT